MLTFNCTNPNAPEVLCCACFKRTVKTCGSRFAEKCCSVHFGIQSNHGWICSIECLEKLREIKLSEMGYGHGI